VQWQYRTILFEFRKDGLLGDKYIDDEEVESLLNEQGTTGWELVNVSTIQEGLLAFCKRPLSVAEGRVELEDAEKSIGHSIGINDAEPEPVDAKSLQQQEREHIRRLEQQRRETMSALEKDTIGEIRIS
jgi:hypothetical protein